jgi:ubiquinone/menaquinone biosynthesis C-methylase UbiE
LSHGSRIPREGTGIPEVLKGEKVMRIEKTMNAIKRTLDKMKVYFKVLFKINSPFIVRDIHEAQKIILTNYALFPSDFRWKVETAEEISVLRNYIQDNSVICDFGIGIGRISQELLKEFKNVKIIGVDSSSQMLKLCRQAIGPDYHNRLELLPFKKMKTIKTGSVDFAFSVYVLQHVPTNLFEPALMELRRILKPEGLLYLLNTYTRCVVDGGKEKFFYNDGIRQLDVISRYFTKSLDVMYESLYMQIILKTHFSALFRPK